MDVSINLISLGSTQGWQCECHTKIHKTGEITRYDLLAIVAHREGVLQDAIERTIYLIQRLPKNSSVSRIEVELSRLQGTARELARRVLREAGMLSQAAS
jgi:hypothetical protein